MKWIIKGLICTSIIFIFLLFPVYSYASLVTVNSKGEVIINVLADETSSGIDLSDPSDFEVKQVASEGVKENSTISIDKEDGKISLVIGNSNKLDVTNWKDNLIELEERPQTRKVKVSSENGDFIINQNGFSAKTQYPISINPLDNQFTLKTAEGGIILKLLPYEAAQSLLRSRIINRVEKGPYQINAENKEASYLIKGEKVINLAGYYDLKLPLEAKLSARTGEIISIENPNWLRFLSVLFI